MMKKRVNKKELEHWHVIQFLGHPGLNVGVINFEVGSDPPDFVLKTDTKTIALEHTQLYNSELKEKEEFRESIIEQANKFFQAKYNVDLYCLVTFMNVRLDGGQPMFNNFSQQLFLEVEKIYLANQKTEFNIIVEYPEIKTEFIDTLRVRNTVGFNNWQHFTAYKHDWIDLERLQSIIANKDKDIKKYSGQFDEHWLLMVSNSGTKSSANRFDFMDFQAITTDFDKVYVYKHMEKEVVQIK